ncbi:MAG TPA: FAD-dependent oxidoreductase [Candidatus Acidoferrales bacterium]|nr:FAD-dependent oxidoreductase [Candidatus Acidoferrales bacterium]
MARETLVVIGAVAAGMSAASRARRLNPQMKIAVLEKGRDVSYGACGLPHYISGDVADANDLVVYTADYFREKRDIEILLQHEAASIEPGRKLVHALHGASQPVAIPYDKLIIATGAAPITDIPGADLPGVFTCNDLASAIRLREFLARKQPKTAIVVGAGYIGLEIADALARRNIETKVLTRAEHSLEGFEPEVQAAMELAMDSQGVRLKAKCEVKQITASGEAEALQAHHANGSEAADLIVLATGIMPRTSLADAAGIRIGASGAIAVDERMQTSATSIYAAGDCAETRHLVSDKPVYFPLGTTANKMGRVAGENVAGGNARFEGIVGTLATKAFGLEVARTGLSSSEARKAGFHPASATIHSVSHAKYLGGERLIATILWDKSSSRLLGFQMAGKNGAAKRVDAAAVALQARMRIADLTQLDLTYAPPFAPVWEALLIAASEASKTTR